MNRLLNRAQERPDPLLLGVIRGNVAREMDTFERAFCKQPTFLYLGTLEYKTALEDDPNGWYNKGKKTDEGFQRYLGLNVIYVNVKSHLAVS